MSGAIDTVVVEGATVVKQGDASVVAPAEITPVVATPAVDPAVVDPAATEVKAEEGTEPKKDGEDADKSKEGAPDAYTDFAFPEGIEVDKSTLAEFVPLAKELNLSQDAAQKLVDLQTKMELKRGEEQLKAWDVVREGWRSAVTADKEIGGNNTEQAVAHAKVALDKFGTPALAEALTTTGTGDHPEFIRAFARIGKAMSEGVIHVGAAAPVADTRTAAQKLFPSMK